MPELPDRPDLDQLRHQARELLRAAVRGEPPAVARLRAVSGRTVLSAAQLAVAREYGFPSWPALKAVVERRRSAAIAAGAAPQLGERQSFGGGAPIETTDGTLRPGLLIAGPGRAMLDGSLAFPPRAAGEPALGDQHGAPLSHEARLEAARRMASAKLPTLDDITVRDDRGATYTLRLEGMSDARHRPGPAVPSPVTLRVEPAPEPGAAWFELRHRSGPATRLLRSPQAVVQVSPVTRTAGDTTGSKLDGLARWLIGMRLGSPSADLARPCSIALARAAEFQDAAGPGYGSELAGQLARLCAAMTGGRPAAGLPPAWSGMLATAGRADGARLRLDIGVTVPALAGLVTRFDSLISGPGTWRLLLRTAPAWFEHAEDGQSKWTPVSVAAQDDLGGSYVSNFGGSSGHDGYEEVTLTFLPRLDPRARRLTLTLTSRGGAEEVAVVVGLPADGTGS